MWSVVGDIFSNEKEKGNAYQLGYRVQQKKKTLLLDKYQE